MCFITVNVEVNEASILSKINSLIDDATMSEISEIFAEMCDPYVPWKTGDLAQNLRTTDAKGVHYKADYADFQYYGTHFQHNTETHPRATALWDKVMMSEQGDLLRERVTEVLARRAKQLYG